MCSRQKWPLPLCFSEVVNNFLQSNFKDSSKCGQLELHFPLRVNALQAEMLARYVSLLAGESALFVALGSPQIR